MRQPAISIVAVSLWLCLTGFSVFPSQLPSVVAFDVVRMRDTACAARVTPVLERHTALSEASEVRAAMRPVNLELVPGGRLTADYRNAFPVQLGRSSAKSFSTTAVYLPAEKVNVPPKESSATGRAVPVRQPCRGDHSQH
jgi:hypothetical protein